MARGFTETFDDFCALLIRHGSIDSQRLDAVEIEDLETYKWRIDYEHKKHDLRFATQSTLTEIQKR